MAMKWFLTVFAIIALAAAIAGSFFGSISATAAGLVGFTGLLITANLDRLAEFKASKSGIEAKTREIFARAEVTIDQLQLLAKTVASLSLSLVKRAGRFGGYSDKEQNRIHEDTVGVLRRIGVSQPDIDVVLHDWHLFVEFDYPYFILGGHTAPDGLDSAAMQDWNSLRGGGVVTIPSPKNVRDFLVKHHLHSDKMRELVDDYEYYCANKIHRRPEVWVERTNWGRLRREPIA
jgi:hypothetical protein